MRILIVQCPVADCGKRWEWFGPEVLRFHIRKKHPELWADLFGPCESYDELRRLAERALVGAGYSWSGGGAVTENDDPVHDLAEFLRRDYLAGASLGDPQ